MKITRLFAYKLTQAEVDAGKANALPAGSTILVIDANGIPTGKSYTATGGGVIEGGSGSSFREWQANAAYSQGQIAVAPLTVGTIGAGDLIVRGTQGTSRATFDATEASKWTEVSDDPDLVKVADIKNDLTSTDTAKPLSAAQGKALQDGKSATTHNHDTTYETKNTNIQSHISATTNPHSVTKAQVGLDSVTNDAQLKVSSNLSDLAAASTARTNLGLGTAATLNVAATGNAATGDVVKGNDTRLTDSRTPTTHTHAVADTSGLQSALDGKAASTHAHAQADVTGLSTALSAKQDSLVSGTNIKTVNGASVLGAGNIAVNADLPGGAATTVTDEGLDSGNAAVDRTSVAGQTILKYNTAGASAFRAPLNVTSIRVLVVGGGGGGGRNHGGGGGGGGGVIDIASHPVIPGQSYTVTVGSGGIGGSTALATAGGSSVFDTVTAGGGGRGGSGENQATDSPGGAGVNGSANGDGGNGGGAAGDQALADGAGAGAAGTPNGFAGGSKYGGVGTWSSGGGGGGASAAGVKPTTTSIGGNGGAGTVSDITSASLGYGGGGGGGGFTGAGGTATDGGGAGASGSQTNAPGGAANRGGGGGGSNGNTGGVRYGGNGGSGIIIVRFTTQTRSYQALSAYANDAAAATAGVLLGQFYKNSTTGAVTQRST